MWRLVRPVGATTWNDTHGSLPIHLSGPMPKSFIALGLCRDPVWCRAAACPLVKVVVRLKQHGKQCHGGPFCRHGDPFCRRHGDWFGSLTDGHYVSSRPAIRIAIPMSMRSPGRIRPEGTTTWNHMCIALPFNICRPMCESFIAVGLRFD